MTEEKLIGNVTCPECKHVQAMEIPGNTCEAFYTCESCKKTISATKSCCVFCDYGDMPCPASQEHKE